MNYTNYIVLVGGLILIAVFWNVISPKERKKETRIVTIALSVLSILVYILQTSLWTSM